MNKKRGREEEADDEVLEALRMLQSTTIERVVDHKLRVRAGRGTSWGGSGLARLGRLHGTSRLVAGSSGMIVKGGVQRRHARCRARRRRHRPSRC